MNTESLIKNRLAEEIVELLFEESGYKIRRIAKEGLLMGIDRVNTANLLESNSAGKITTAPSFALLDKKGSKVALLKVKFKSVEGSGRNISHGLGQLQKYWSDALLLVVTPQKPFFSIVYTVQSEEPLEKIFPLKKETLTKFETLVEKFFREKDQPI